MQKDKKNKAKDKKDSITPKNVNPASKNKIYSDVLGSYTGITEDGEKPIQDADDL